MRCRLEQSLSPRLILRLFFNLAPEHFHNKQSLRETNEGRVSDFPPRADHVVDVPHERQPKISLSSHQQASFELHSGDFPVDVQQEVRCRSASESPTERREECFEDHAAVGSDLD